MTLLSTALSRTAIARSSTSCAATKCSGRRDSAGRRTRRGPVVAAVPGPAAGAARAVASGFGEDEYYLAFLGTPSATTPWMLQFGGHHLAINLTLAGSQASMAPSLPAAQPASYTFEGQTIRPLGTRERQGVCADQCARRRRSAARRSSATASSDLVLGPGQDGRTIQPEGIRASALTAAQQTMLWDLVREWAGIMNDAFAEPRMAEIRATSPTPSSPGAARPPTAAPPTSASRADAGHRVRAAGRRRSHPHHLSRSDQRLRSEVCAEVDALAGTAGGRGDRHRCRRRAVGASARRVPAGSADRRSNRIASSSSST